MHRTGVTGLLLVALLGVSACGTDSTSGATSGALPGLSAKAAADLCSSALAGDPNVRPVVSVPPSSIVIRCRTDLRFGATNLAWQLSRSTGSLTDLQADLRRPDRIEPGVQFCTSIGMPEYQFLAVSSSGAMSVLRMPHTNCGPLYPTDKSMDSAGFERVGTFSMELQP